MNATSGSPGWSGSRIVASNAVRIVPSDVRLNPGCHAPVWGRPQFSAMKARIEVWSSTSLTVRSRVGAGDFGPLPLPLPGPPADGAALTPVLRA